VLVQYLAMLTPPDQGSEKKGTRGVNFQQLRQVTGVRFKKSRITQVVEMFSSWEDRVLQRQHRMVCSYFVVFENLFDVMIDPNEM
jgi:hypothetical protein